jgi:Peptidase family M48
MAVLKLEESHRTLRLWVLLSLVLVVQTNAAVGRNRAEYNARKLKSIVNELRKQLGIPQDIEFAVVSKNDLVVSVQPVRARTGPFKISFEQGFLNVLDDGDLRAVVAHELGHVWIFTHHPYLQTEELANDIAHKAVTSDSLDRVYEKLRSRPRVSGNLAASMH